MPEDVATKRGIVEGWAAAHVHASNRGPCKGVWKRVAEFSEATNSETDSETKSETDSEAEKDLTSPVESRTSNV